MCELATVATIATVAGAAISAYGAVQQGQAQASSAKYQAAVASNNAQISAWNAQAATDAAAAKQQQEIRVGDQRLSAQRAALGAAGVTLDSPSALSVQSATEQQTALNAATTGYQGSLAAYGYRTQEGSFQNQSTLDSMQADNAITSGYIGGAGSLLSGAGQVASKWAVYNKTGAWGATA